ncbi:MAG: hypothetical protein E6575_04740 [Bradyrhizobium sp.]|nr:hypothetical protein [Bradyrhizobium sp.]
MIRPAIRQFAAAIVLLAFATPGTAAAQDTGECVASQLRSDPESVIAACSRLIADGAKPKIVDFFKKLFRLHRGRR